MDDQTQEILCPKYERFIALSPHTAGKYHELLEKQAEKAKQDEKETKKLQDSVRSLQLRLAAREHICRNLQEKVRDLENQLREERKTRIKQENRALATVSTSNQAQKASADNKKPPLAPSSKLRLPLRRITNFIPNPSPFPPNKKGRMLYLSVVNEDKENTTSRTLNNRTTKPVLKPRRGSIAVRPTPPQAAAKTLQPKRRASIATFRPESNSTPLHRSRTERVVGRQSFVWDPQRVRKTSRGCSPLPPSREVSVEATPVGPRSSKFRGSPPPSQQVGSWKPKHPTVVALQKKQLVWSPLKLKGMRNQRNSMLSSKK